MSTRLSRGRGALVVAAVACALSLGLVTSAVVNAGPTTSTTNDATLVRATTATLNGTVNPGGVSGSWRFEYGLSADNLNLTAVCCGGELPPSTSDQQYAVALSDLTPNTTYFFRIVSSNNDCASPPCVSNGEVKQFTTTAPDPPAVVTGAATAIDQTSATLNGTIDNRGRDATYHFEYGTSPALGASTAGADLAAGPGDQAVSAAITNLAPATTYYVALVATTVDGTTRGATVPFTTAAPPPIVITDGSENVMRSTATIKGRVFSGGVPASYHFEYGTTPALGTSGPVGQLPAGTAGQAVSLGLVLLTPGTRYYFKLVATTSAGTDEGATLFFETVPLGPAVVTGAAEQITPTTARVNGTIDNRNNNATYHFEYGTTPALGTWSQDTNLPAAQGTLNVNATLTGLTPATTYYYALSSTNDGGEERGQTLTFTTAAPPPAVVTTAATNITGTAATVNGTIDNKGFAATYHFEYSTVGGQPISTADATLPAGSGAQAVSSNLAGLTTSTNYTVRLVATTAGGTVAGESVTFKTLPAPPQVTTGNAQFITTSGARLDGLIVNQGAATTYHFEYGTTAALGTSTPDQTLPAGPAGSIVFGDLAGLSQATIYYYALVATTAGGTTRGETKSFATKAPPPTVVTNPATNITHTAATLNGTIDNKGFAATYRFDYTNGSGVTTSTATVSLPAGTGAQAVSANLAGLTASTLYTAKLVATTIGGTVTGSTVSFNTAATPQPPIVTTTAATAITPTAATLNGTIDNRSRAATFHFEYGPTAALGTSTANVSLAAGTGAKTVSTNATGLSQLTHYYYALVATTSEGTARGAVVEFDSGFTPVVRPTSQTSFVFIDSPTQQEGAAEDYWNGDRELECKTVYDRNTGTNIRVCDFTGAKIIKHRPYYGQMVFTLTLNPAPVDPVVVRVKTTPGTARPLGATESIAAGTTADYLPGLGTASHDVTFAPGQTTAVIPVTVLGDNDVEGDETFVLSGEVLKGDARMAGVGTGTILNDDGTPSPLLPKLQDGTPTVSVGNGAVLENGLGPDYSAIYMPVRLSFPSKVEQKVNISTTDGTAKNSPPKSNGDDFWFQTSQTDATQVVFKPGETTKVVPITPRPDLEVEPDETFTLNAGSARGTAVILNDDPTQTPAQIAAQEKQHNETVTSLYQDSTATGYEYDMDGNGTYETKCSTPVATGSYPATAVITAGVNDVLSRLGISTTRSVRAANDAVPASYSFAARAVTINDKGETVPLGPTTYDKSPASTVTVDKAYVLARLYEARQRLKARLAEVKKAAKKATPRAADGVFSAQLAQVSSTAYNTQLQAEIQKQIDVILKARGLVNNPSGPAPEAVRDAIRFAVLTQTTTPITAACAADSSKLESCPQVVIYKFVEMAFPSDAASTSCFRKVAASSPAGTLGTATGLQYRSDFRTPILVNGLRLQDASIPVVDEKVDEKIAHVGFVLDTAANTLFSVSDITGLPPLAGIYGEIKPSDSVMGPRYLLNSPELIAWPVDRASKVSDASSTKKAIADYPSNKSKIEFAATYGRSANIAMSLGGILLNGIDEIHLLRKRSAAFGSFMLPTLVRPTDAELADPNRKKSSLELLQGVTVQTVFNVDNTKGILFDGLNAKVAEVPGGNLFKIKDLSLSYVKSSDEWRGSLELLFPPTAAFGAKGSFAIRGGKLVELSAAALFNPGIQLGCCVRLTKVGGSYANTFWDPDGCLESPSNCAKYKSDHAGTLPPNNCLTDASRRQCETGVQVAGNVGLVAGPKLKIKGADKDLLGIDGSLRFVDSTTTNPWALTANADFSLLNELTFGNAVITYINGQQFTGYGRVDKTFKAACLELSLNAMLGLDIFSATKWQAFAGVGIGGSLCGVFSFAFQQEILASSRGIGACASVRTPVGETFGSGVIYTWADSALNVFSGCSHGLLVEQGGVTATRSLRAAGAPKVVSVPGGLPTYLFKLTGATAPPSVVLTGPGGQVIDTTNTAGGKGYVTYYGASNDTYIDVRTPQAGDWTVTVKDGSSPVTRIETADGIPDPSVKATVGGKGRARVLRYDVRDIKGQTIRFAERLPGKDGTPGPSQILGETGAASGRISFSPAAGPAGKRTVEATVFQDGQPRRLLKVATYVAPGPFRPGRPKVRMHRKGSSIVISWPKVSGAEHYRVLVRTTVYNKGVGNLVGKSLFYTRKPNRRTLVVKNVAKAERIAVSVTAVTRGGILGKTAHRARTG